MDKRHGFILIPSALLCDGQPGMDDWEQMSSYLTNVQRSANWWIGDLLVYGEAQLGDEIYQALDQTLSLSHLQRCAKVSREFAFHQRMPEVSWTQHAMLLPFDGAIRAAVLERSKCEGWDSEQMKRYLQELRD